MTHIYVDADACPVKQEVYRVARRYGLEVARLVVNNVVQVTDSPFLAQKCTTCHEVHAQPLP